MTITPQTEHWRNPAEMNRLLQDGYDERLFFHVYEHAADTRDIARELGKWVIYEEQKKPASERSEVDFYVLDWAALGHDYGYFQYSQLSPSMRTQYPSREKYAAAMVGGFMSSAGAPQEKIDAVKAAIWSTEAGVTCTSLEGKILRQADLANVGNANRAAFFWNTVKLYREHRLMNNQNPNILYPKEFIAYAFASYKLLSKYNSEDVSLGDFDRSEDGDSTFHKFVAENIQWLLPERVRQLAQQAGCDFLKETS